MHRFSLALIALIASTGVAHAQLTEVTTVTSRVNVPPTSANAWDVCKRQANAMPILWYCHGRRNWCGRVSLCWAMQPVLIIRLQRRVSTWGCAM